MLNQILNLLQNRIATEIGADRQAPFFGDRAGEDFNDPTARPAPVNLPPPLTTPRPHGVGDTAVLVVPVCAGRSPSTRRQTYNIKVGVSMLRANIALGSEALAEAVDTLQTLFGPDQVICLGLPNGSAVQVKLLGGEDSFCIFSPEMLPENRHLSEVRDIRFAFAFLVKVSL